MSWEREGEQGTLLEIYKSNRGEIDRRHSALSAEPALP